MDCDINGSIDISSLLSFPLTIPPSSDYNKYFSMGVGEGPEGYIIKILNDTRDLGPSPTESPGIDGEDSFWYC